MIVKDVENQTGQTWNVGVDGFRDGEILITCTTLREVSEVA